MKQSMAIPMPGLTGSTWLKAGLALGLAFAQAGIGMAAEPAPAVKAGVYAKHVGNKIVYYYRVTNNSPQSITAVSIGHDSKNDADPANDVWELVELPSGWNSKLGIPSASSNSPMGWRVSKTAPDEDSKTHAITWEISNDKSPVLASGETLAKMSIALDQADSNYLTGHALVTFSDGSPVAAKGSSAPASKNPAMSLTVPLDTLDNSPPTLSVTITPNTIWSPDGRHMPVNVSFTKEDNYDNLPVIKLESVTANEPLEPDDVRDASYGIDDRYLRLRSKHNGSTERVYTLTYSATDASGNRATASATVTVPVAEPVAAPAPVATPVAASAPVPAPVTATKPVTPAVTPKPAPKPAPKSPAAPIAAPSR